MVDVCREENVFAEEVFLFFIRKYCSKKSRQKNILCVVETKSKNLRSQLKKRHNFKVVIQLCMF